MRNNRFNKGDKVVVHGCDLAFVVRFYIGNNVALLIEGEDENGTHHVIYAKEEVLLPNNEFTMHSENWQA